MNSTSIHGKKAQTARFVVPGILFIIICITLIIPTNALTIPRPVTITANYLGERPFVTFTPTLQSGVVPLTVTFSSYGTTGTPVLTYGWDFGDGVYSSEQSPSHTYLEAGTYIVQLTVTNAAGSSSASGTIIVNSATITISPASLPAGVVGTPYPQQTFLASGGTAPYLYSIMGSLPPGLTFSSNTISGTPTASGSYTLTITATDAFSSTVSQSYSITIPVPPTAAFTYTATGLFVTFDSSTSTGAGLIYAWTFGDGTTSTAANPTHTYATGGSYPVTLIVSNAGGTSTPATATITIAPAIVITTTSPLPPGTVGTLYSQTIIATGGTGTLTFSGTPPAGLTLSPAGVISGTPTTAGTSSFTITATDTLGNTVSADFTITIAPAIVITTASPLPPGTVGTLYSQTITATGGTGTLTFSGTPPAGLTLSPAGVISGTPTTAGTSSFTITATDTLGNTVSADFTITIAPAIVITTASPLPPGTVGTLYSQTIIATGGTGTLTFSGTPPAGLTLSPSGVISGIPATAGTSTFTITVTDTNLATETKDFSITITAPTPIPLPPGSEGATYSADIPATGWSGSSDFSLAPGSELPPDLKLNTVTGIISGTIRSPPSVPYTYSFTITATDSEGHSVSQTFTITVTAAPPKPPSTGGTDDLDNTNIGVSFGEPAVALSQDLLAPPQENVVGSGLAGFTGITVTTQPSGDRVLDVAPELAGAVSIVGNTITVTQPGYTLEIVVAGKITEEDGHIVGYNIESILLTTDPVDANITIGNVSAYLEAYLNSLPKGAEIKTSISLPGELDLMKAFQEALRKEGKTLDGWAYNYNVDKKNFDSCGSTNVTMTVTQKWLTESKQTIENVHIIRVADDGSTQVLPIISIVRDPITGDYTLTGYSRDGCSVFGLVTAKATAVEQAEQPNATVVAVSKPAMSTNVGMYGWLMGIVTENPWIILIIGAVVALVAYFGWYRRRL